MRLLVAVVSSVFPAQAGTYVAARCGRGQPGVSRGRPRGEAIKAETMETTKRHFDVIVVGVGGMGSATTYHLAQRGARVLGLEQFGIPHEQGSSHGHTRIIRQAYYEHPSYVPLLLRAYELWQELETAVDEQLLFITGILNIGAPGTFNFEGAWRSAQDHDLPHEVLSADDVNRRYPACRLPEEMRALYEPLGGFLPPERCIVAHVEQAMAAGAEVHGHEAVTDWRSDGDGVRVTTTRDTYSAGRLVLTAGAWVGKLLAELRLPLQVERQVLGWFQPEEPELFRVGRLPVLGLVGDEGYAYGTPVYGVPGFKIGKYHHRGEVVDPNTVTRTFDAEDEEVLRAFLRRYFPLADGPIMQFKVCMFTNTPDEHFILDRHPEWPQVCLASACSGHGFKMTSVVGEIMADLALDGETRHDIDLFRLARFAGATAAPATASAR